MKRMKRNLLMIFLLVCMGFLMLGITATAVHATLYFIDDAESPYASKLWELDTVTGTAIAVGSGNSGVYGKTVGLSPSGISTVLYGSTPFYFSTIQADGSAATWGGNNVGIEGLAYDPRGDGTAYGAANGSFFTIDPSNGAKASTLAAAPADIEGLAYGNGGIFGLAGAGTYSGWLYFYDIRLGTWSEIGDTGIDFDNTGLAYDTDLDILYAVGNQDSYLYSINPSTAALNFIGNTGFSEGGGLAYVSSGFVPVPEPATMIFLGLGMIGLAGMRRKI